MIVLFRFVCSHMMSDDTQDKGEMYCSGTNVPLTGVLLLHDLTFVKVLQVSEVDRGDIGTANNAFY